MRSARICVILAVLPLLAASCGAGSSSGEIRFLVFGEPEELKAFREVVAAYGEVEPEVEVQLIEASDRDDLIARLSTSIAGGRPPDLVMIN